MIIHAHATTASLVGKGSVRATAKDNRLGRTGNYVDRLIYICHKRGTFAMGGMAAQIPIKGNPAENDAAMARIKKDKIREALVQSHPHLAHFGPAPRSDRQRHFHDVRDDDDVVSPSPPIPPRGPDRACSNRTGYSVRIHYF